jgi:hypothetical protein
MGGMNEVVYHNECLAMSDDLPQLPEPDGSAEVLKSTREQLIDGRMQTVDEVEYVDAWSLELVRSYGEACAKAAREREREACARDAESFASVFKGGKKLSAAYLTLESFAATIRGKP